ncbi:MAG: hypothetical protein IPP05_19960 [Cytophagaceae bacterium]|nr:hypothetical protein [Cytophagaceae bacterium]
MNTLPIWIVLQKSGSLQIAGIIDQDLENHTGIIILTTNNYMKTKVALNKPSVKEGMMSVVIRPINIYFKTEK